MESPSQPNETNMFFIYFCVSLYQFGILDLGLKERVMLYVLCACFDSWHD